MRRANAGRGRWSRGSGSGYRRDSVWISNQQSSDVTADRPEIPFGSPLETIRSAQIQVDSASNARITAAEHIGSFNLMESKIPSILVPGMPPLWTPRETPQVLPEDSGEYYRDVNWAFSPTHPLEPAVEAIMAQNPAFDTHSIDVFACGSTLGNLLRFVSNDDMTFRFVVEVVGDTVFFVRRGKSPTEKIEDVKGFGHTFPERYTTWDQSVKGSVSHQRLMRYDFGGLQFLVRYECDGYLTEKAPRPSASDEVAASPSQTIVEIKAAGREIPQAACFELKTRSVRRQQDTLAEQLNRLWIRQIPNFILAKHDSGTFVDVQVRDVTRDISVWETRHQLELRRLAALIARIVARAKQSPTRFEVCCQSTGLLEIRQVGGSFCSAISDALSRVWAGDQVSDSESEEDTTGEESDIYAGSDPESAGVPVLDEENDVEDDFTACSELCGYCGRCKC